MAKIQNGEVADLIAFSKASSSIGDVRESMLTIQQFEEENLGQWFLMDGRSCVGTTYHSITGNTNVPDMVTNGTFVRQASGGRTLGSYQVDDLKSHNHVDGYAGVNSGAAYGVTSAPAGNINQQSGTSTNNHAFTSSTGGAETRPKNIALNFFIKVGY